MACAATMSALKSFGELFMLPCDKNTGIAGLPYLAVAFNTNETYVAEKFASHAAPLSWLKSFVLQSGKGGVG
jgi:hypothetical protein